MNAELLHVVCANCDAVNRVPRQRLKESPVCGRCKQSLFPEDPIALNTGNFNKFIARCDLPIIVDFWAPWCQPCLMMAPHFKTAAQQLSPQVIFAKLDTQAHPEPATPYRIAGIPTMIHFSQGQEKNRTSGAMQADEIVQWVQSVTQA